MDVFNLITTPLQADWQSAALTWLPFAFSVVVAVATEKSSHRLSRLDFIGAFFLRMGLMALIIVGLGVLVSLLPVSAFDNARWARHIAALVIVIWQGTAVVLMTRIMVHRLRDAGFGKNWAYLFAVPGLGMVLILLVTFYPPSRPPSKDLVLQVF